MFSFSLTDGYHQVVIGQGWVVMKLTQTVRQMLSETMKQTVLKMTIHLMLIDAISMFVMDASEASFKSCNTCGSTVTMLLSLLVKALHKKVKSSYC